MNDAVESGERTYLRHPAAEDREIFLASVRASRRLHAPWVSPPSTPAAFDEYLRRSERDDALCYLVCREGDGALTGVANVSEIVRGNLASGYLGYYAFEPFAGHGYMSEGLRLVMRHVFGAAGLHRLEANVQPRNEASMRLVERLGFRREGFSERYLKVRGRWRDHVRWAILAEDFFTTEAERRHT